MTVAATYPAAYKGGHLLHISNEEVLASIRHLHGRNYNVMRTIIAHPLPPRATGDEEFVFSAIKAIGTVL